MYPKDSFGQEIYSVLAKHKILKNILPKGVDYNTRTSIEDIINSEIPAYYPLHLNKQEFFIGKLAPAIEKGVLPMSRKHLSPEEKHEILRKHFEEGRTVKSLCDEYFLAHSTIEKLITDYRKECQQEPKLQAQSDMYEENRKLRSQNANLQDQIKQLKSQVLSLQRTIARIS